MNAKFNKGIIDIMAKENNAKDIAHMERLIEFLKEDGYEEVFGDGDYNVILGAGRKIDEMKDDYSYYKKLSKEI